MAFKKIATALTTGVSAAIMLGASFASAAEEITVAYFLEWPTPNQYAQNKKLYDEAMGVKVNWVAFDTGTAMSAAMASGDIQLAFSQGVTPFLVAASQGQDLQVIDVAVSYSDNDNCVVRSSLEIDKTNAKELEGKEVGVPLGTAAHTGFLKQMEHFGVDTATMKVVDMSPPDAAAAFANGNLDMVCGWGGALRRMKEHGAPILSGPEKEKVVGKVFDVTSVNGAWGKENAELVAKFLKVTADMNAKYKDGGKEEMLPIIAKEAGMDVDKATAIIDIFAFPSIEEQISSDWMVDFMPKFLKESADKLAEGGEVEALETYEGAVNADYLKAAAAL